MSSTVVTATKYRDDLTLRQDFDRNGYVSIAGGIGLSSLGEAKESLALGIEMFLNRPRAGGGEEGTSTESFIDAAIIELNRTRKGQDELFLLHSTVRHLAVFHGLTAETARLASRIVGNQYPFSVISSGFMLGLPEDSRLAYDFHQESSYMLGARDIMNVHFPFLRPSTIENGTMSALEGSHHQGPLPSHRSKESDNSYTNFVPKNIEDLKANYREVAFHLELGDILYFSKDLVHKSNPNLTAALRPPAVFRLTQDLRYQFPKTK